MKYLLIILISLTSFLASAQDILADEREPIIVETKADLQTELELSPIQYLREVKPDSLQKFNYSYHGRPLKSDFFLFPERDLRNYLNLSGGSHDLFEVTNQLFIKDYSLRLNYLKQDDEGDRSVNSFSMLNTYSFQNHKLAFSAEFLESKKETSLLEARNKTQNIALSYSLVNSPLKLITKLSVEGQFETNSPSLTSTEEEYWNIFSELELQPLNNIFTNFKFINNHKEANGQIQLFYQDYSSFGLWSGINNKKALIAPYLDLYLNYKSLTLKLTNTPYIERQSFVQQYQNHLYGNFAQESTDFLIPANANVELSYFNFLTWSIGSHYKYALDAPVYRLGAFGEGIYCDDYWETAHYAKLGYLGHKFNLSTKGEVIDYKNFNSDYIPFKPELRITNSVSLNLRKLTVGADYIFETKARDDYDLTLDDSHILNAYANYQLNNKISFWTEFTNLLDKDSNNFFQDQINKREFKAGMKLFF